MYTLVSVDDERYFHRGLDRLVDWQELGYIRIGEAYDGESALELIEAERPNVVITDIRMPGIDGLELIDRVSALDEYRPDWIILSAYDNFSYAKKAMQFGVQHYLLKPVDEDELKQILAKISDERQREARRPKEDTERTQLVAGALIRRLIQGQPGQAVLQRGLEVFGGHGPYRFVQALLSQSAQQDPEQVFRDLLVRAFPKQQPPMLCGFGRLSYGFVLQGSLRPPEIKDQLQRLHFHCSQVLGGKLYFSVGTEVPDLAALHETYHSAQFAMNKNMLCFNSPYVLADELEPLEDVHEYDAARDLLFIEDLLSDIESDDRQGIEDQLHRLIDRLRKKQAGQGALKIWVNSLFIDVSRLIFELDGKIDETLRSFYQRSTSDPGFFLGDFFGEIFGFCTHAADLIQELKRLNRSGIIMVISDYVRANYQKALSLKDLGEQFSMNPAYLGRLFKDTLGKPFKQFLSEVRISEAKKLLTRTDLKVYEVASSVGYCDCDYFSEQFLRLTGESPGAYRQGKN